MGTKHKIVKCHGLPNRLAVAPDDPCQCADEWRGVTSGDPLFADYAAGEFSLVIGIISIQLMVIEPYNKDSSAFVIASDPRQPR